MISAVVLAAGEAKRFGGRKQLALVDGKLLLQRAIDNVNASAADEVIAVLGANAEEIRGRIDFGRARVVLNPNFAEGMSTSIQAGLRATTDAEAALIVLGDQPFVAPATMNAIIDEYRRTAAPAVVPTYDGVRGNPVLVARALFADMMKLRGDAGCRGVFGEHAVVKLAVDDRGVVMDIDEPDALTRRFAAPSPAHAGEGEQPGPLPRERERVAEGRVRDLLEIMVDLRKRRQPFATATVVRAERPTSSKPGDKAIIAPDGTLTGWIGGSCAHDIVVRQALEALAEGTPRFLTLGGMAPSAIPMQCYSGGVLDVFIEPSLPAPRMIVVGNETIAQALVRFSRNLRFDTMMIDRLDGAAITPGGETFVVVATHGRFDEEALEQAVKTDASYIALVASPKRAATILQVLRESGVDVSRIKSPAGLDIGAQGAEEIALSIVAEIVQLRRAKIAAEPANTPSATEAIDPICQMTVTIAGARFTAEHEGRRYYFCCAHCQRTFEKEPQRYAHVA